MNSESYLLASAVFVVAVAFIYRRYASNSVAYIRGPAGDSFITGHLNVLGACSTGEVHFRWQEEFGAVVRYKGLFGANKLMISDPKALQYILHTSAYNFEKPRATRQMVKTSDGPDLVWSEGDVHRRQRKVMLPAFGAPESKALFPVFKTKIDYLVARWQDMLSNTSSTDAITVNVHEWLSRITLDAIGQAAFDYRLGAMDEDETELGKIYQNLVIDTNPPAKALTDALLEHIPFPLLHALFEYVPYKPFQRMREHRLATHRVAKQLVAMKGHELLQGKANRDVFSLLLKANGSEASKNRLTDEELLAEMSIIFVAGHETTANTLTWSLFELAKNPSIQARIREEIRASEAAVRARGDSEFTLADIEGLAYFQASLKEAMRLHPVVFELLRVAVKDVVLPLSQPIVDIYGETRHELIIPKGTELKLPIGCYNMDKTLWGEDAHEFNPERWLKGDMMEKKATTLGVVGNLLNFSSGTRSCIGWRFAMTEVQCFLVELLNTFQFSLPTARMKVQKVGYGIVVPRLEDEVEMGTQLPLCVSTADRG